MISPRTREARFLVPAALVVALGVATVATARAHALRAGPVVTVAIGLALLVVMHVALRLRAPQADPYVLPTVGVLTAIGMVTLYRINPDLARDQLVWLAVAAVVFVGVPLVMPDHRVLERYHYLIGILAVALLLLTAAFGTVIYGAKLWITLPGGQTVQPGEVVKVLIVIFLAGYMRDKRELLAVPTRRILGIPAPPMAVLGPMLVVLGLALALVAALNDFGTALMFFGVFLAMIYVATGRAAYVGVGAGLFLAGAVAIWAAVPRIQDRVDSWLHPFQDPQDRGYQMVQSLYALADGGVVGTGLGKGFLVNESGRPVIPFLETDFIFTAVGTELGFIGAMGVLALIMLLVARGFTIAARANDGFSKLLAAGLTTILALQAFIIVGGVVRLVPLTGVTLPFLSYGGSSVVTNFGIIAILLVISHRTDRPYRPRVKRRDRAAADAPPAWDDEP